MRHIAKEKRVLIENNVLKASLNYTEGVLMEEFSHIKSTSPMNQMVDLFEITIRGKKLKTSDFIITDVSVCEDSKMELVTFTLEQKEECLKTRIHILNDRDASITILWQIADFYKKGVPSVSRLHIPFLAQMNLGEWKTDTYYPSGIKRSRDGRDIMKRPTESFYGSDIRLPMVIVDQENEVGFSVKFASLSDLSDEGSTQNISHLLWAYIDNEEHLKDHNILINPDSSFNDTLELKITGLNKGWPEAFDRDRKEWAANYDFSEYQREDLKWIRDCPVNHFAFLYGKEAYDHDTQKINVERLLKEGEKFGGYDTVTIWNQYPRLGVDSRTQWEFYDDFPGGRKAIKDMVDECHKKGVKVLLPYIPWDRADFESTDSMGDEFARIVEDTGADGYQLDTCKDLPLSYRKKLDAVRPGLLLQTQAHPYKKQPMEFITSSWDEFWYENPMPEVDLLRFMLPQHVAPMISRWLRDEDKDLLIRRCIFGAAPIVIWQDIFGRWMPFSEEQKAAIKVWKQAYIKYKDIYFGDAPIPLYPVKVKDVYCNLFRSRESKEVIFSFYNDSKEDKVFPFEQRELEATEVVTVLGSNSVVFQDKKIMVHLPAGEVMHILVK